MENAFSVKDKKVLIVGAGSGIGRACAKLFATLNANVIASSKTLEKLESLKQEFPSIEISAIDFTDKESAKAFAQNVENIDVLIWTAGIDRKSLIKFSQDDEFEKVLQTNLVAPVFFTKKLLENKKINRGASLVYISSVASLMAQPTFSSYASSKAALTAFVRNLALEIAPRQCRANAISPALVRTPMTESFISENLELVKIDKKKYLLGYGEPEDIANSALFLATNASKWITGINLIVDGGYTCQK